MPQRHLEHHLLTASATVDGNAVTMLTDNGSANAEAPLRVVNTRGFDLPKTGDNGTKMLTIAGTLLILCAGGCVVLLIASKRKKGYPPVNNIGSVAKCVFATDPVLKVKIAGESTKFVPSPAKILGTILENAISQRAQH